MDEPKDLQFQAELVNEKQEIITNFSFEIGEEKFDSRSVIIPLHFQFPPSNIHLHSTLKLHLSKEQILTMLARMESFD